MKNKNRKVKVVKKKDSSDDSSDSSKKSDEEEEDQEESSSEDDLGECVVLEEGKYKLSQAFSDKMARERIEKEERRK